MPPRRRTDLRAAAARTQPGTPAPGTTGGAVRSGADPVKTTLHLDPQLWGDVHAWLSAEVAVRRRKVPLAEVGRILLTLLTTDEEVARKVRDTMP